MAPRFELTSDWLLPGTIEEVAALLSDVGRLPERCPEVYLAVQLLDPGGPDGLGRRVAFVTRGRLPFALRWHGTVVETRAEGGWTIEAIGDVVGRGVWRLEQRGPLAVVGYDWRVEVARPPLRQLVPLLKPMFAANHRWAMDRLRDALVRALDARDQMSSSAASLCHSGSEAGRRLPVRRYQ